MPLADELRLSREAIPCFAGRDQEWILERNALAIWKCPRAGVITAA